MRCSWHFSPKSNRFVPAAKVLQEGLASLTHLQLAFNHGKQPSVPYLIYFSSNMWVQSPPFFLQHHTDVVNRVSLTMSFGTNPTIPHLSPLKPTHHASAMLRKIGRFSPPEDVTAEMLQQLRREGIDAWKK